MPRPRNKEDLLFAAGKGYSQLLEFIASMSETELSTPFCFDENKTESHWKRDKCLRDVIVHLYEWQTLLLKFVENNRYASRPVPFLPLPYSWKTYPDMNREIFTRHQDTSLEKAMTLLEESHKAVIALAEGYTNEQLFTKKFYSWTGTTDLGSYFVSTTSSHYDWALKKLKEHRKVCRR